MNGIWFAIVLTSLCFLLGCASIATGLFKIAKALRTRIEDNETCLLTGEETWDDIPETEEMPLGYYSDVILIMTALGEKLKLFVPGELDEQAYSTGVMRMAENTKKLANPSIKHNPPLLADALADQLFTLLTMAARASIPLDEIWLTHIEYWHTCIQSQTSPDSEEAYQPYWKQLNKVLAKYGWQPPEVN